MFFEFLRHEGTTYYNENPTETPRTGEHALYSNRNSFLVIIKYFSDNKYCYEKIIDIRDINTFYYVYFNGRNEGRQTSWVGEEHGMMKRIVEHL